MASNPHDGHRQRMRERYLAGGLEGFAPHEALEFLLFFALPRVNVNPLAHTLMDHFGSLDAVLEASPEELMRVTGVGASAASLISMVLPLSRYARRVSQAARARLTNLKSAKDYCKHLFHGRMDEVLYVISLDTQGRVLHATPVIVGTIDEIPVYPRKIVSEALFRRAHSVLLAHNHPSGIAEPSDNDIRTNETLRTALNTVDILLLDHIIYADGNCTSIRQWEQESAAPRLSVMPAPRKAADVHQPRKPIRGHSHEEP